MNSVPLPVPNGNYYDSKKFGKCEWGSNGYPWIFFFCCVKKSIIPDFYYI